MWDSLAFAAPPCRLAGRHAVRHPVALRLSASILCGPGLPPSPHASLGRTLSVKLRHDIRRVLRFERADLAIDLTLAHVTAAIQYHLRTAPLNRPLGEKLCAEFHGGKTKRNRVTF